MRRISYESRLMLGGQHLALLGVVAAVVMGYWTQVGQWNPVEAGFYLRVLEEVILPLIVLLAFGHILLIDDADGVLELKLSYPMSRELHVLRRMGLALVYSVVLFVGAMLSLQPGFQVDWREAWLAFGPPTMILLGLAWAVGVIGRSALAGLTASALYWVVELLTHGTYTRSLFLFRVTWPAEVTLTFNRVLLIDLAVAGAVAAVILFRRSERFVD